MRGERTGHGRSRTGSAGAVTVRTSWRERSIVTRWLPREGEDCQPRHLSPTRSDAWPAASRARPGQSSPRWSHDERRRGHPVSAMRGRAVPVRPGERFRNGTRPRLRASVSVLRALRADRLLGDPHRRRGRLLPPSGPGSSTSPGRGRRRAQWAAKPLIERPRELLACSAASPHHRDQHRAALAATIADSIFGPT